MEWKEGRGRARTARTAWVGVTRGRLHSGALEAGCLRGSGGPSLRGRGRRAGPAAPPSGARVARSFVIILRWTGWGRRGVLPGPPALLAAAPRQVSIRGAARTRLPLCRSPGFCGPRALHGFSSGQHGRASASKMGCLVEVIHPFLLRRTASEGRRGVPQDPSTANCGAARRGERVAASAGRRPRGPGEGSRARAHRVHTAHRKVSLERRLKSCLLRWQLTRSVLTVIGTLRCRPGSNYPGPGLRDTCYHERSLVRGRQPM